MCGIKTIINTPVAASLAAAALIGVTQHAVAAPVTWQPAFEVQSDADVHLAGQQVVYAVNAGDNVGNPTQLSAGSSYPAAQTLTIGGQTISFEGVSVLYGPTSTFGADSYGDVQDHLYGQNANVTFQAQSERGTALPQSDWDYAHSASLGYVRNYTPTTGNANLDSILNSMVWSDARTANSPGSALTIYLNNLTPGTLYQVQFFGPADSRPTDSGKIDKSLNVDYVEDDAGSIGSNLGADMDLNGDGQSHVTSLVGTFVADQTGYERLSVLIQDGRNPGVSAIILSTAAAAPEPASLAILAVGGAALLRRRKPTVR